MNLRLIPVFLAGLVVGVLGVGVAVYGLVPELREGKPVGYMEKFDPQCHPETGYLSGYWKEGGEEGRYLTCGKMEGKYFAWNGSYLAVEGRMLDGKREGEYLFYAKDGSIRKKVLYRGGKPVEGGAEG
jgi:hypothetical protein